MTKRIELTVSLHVMIVPFTMDLDPMSSLANPWRRHHGVVEISGEDLKQPLWTMEDSSPKGNLRLPDAPETPVEFGSESYMVGVFLAVFSVANHSPM